MSIKAQQIKMDANNKLLISGANKGTNGIAQGMAHHADSQVQFELNTTGTSGIKFTLVDNTVVGAGTVDGNGAAVTSQIVAKSITAADIKNDAITNDLIAADAIGVTEISGADGVTTTGVDYNFSGVDSFSVPTPTADGHAATKKYVDDKAQGLDFKDSVVVATTAALSATYDDSALTLTNSGSQAAIAIDGVTLVAGDRLLVKDQAEATDNGIYAVTTVGDGSTNWVITRSNDFNTNAEITAGAYVLITEGTSNKLNAYVLESAEGGNDPVLDSDTATANGTKEGDLDWILFSGSATSVAGGNGIAVSGVTVAVDLATSSGLEFASNKLAINPATSIEINGSDEVAVKLGGQSASNQNESLIVASSTGNDGLAVKVDGSTIAVGTNGIPCCRGAASGTCRVGTLHRVRRCGAGTGSGQ